MKSIQAQFDVLIDLKSRLENNRLDKQLKANRMDSSNKVIKNTTFLG